MMKKTNFGCLVLLAVSTVGALSAGASAAEKTPARRILFVGNSYTQQSWGAIRAVFQGHHIEKHAKGGAKLTGWAKDEKLTEKIKNGRWDFVVLQDQSQVPSLPGPFVKGFHEAVETLAQRIRAAGAKTVLFMTWGRRDGDKRNKTINPTFEKMQQRLSKSYREAADRHHARLAPIGEVFGLIRQKHPELFAKLYKKDGSHPSGLGAHVAAYAFGKVMVGLDPMAQAKDKDEDLKRVAEAVSEVLKAQKDQRQAKESKR